MNLLNDDIIKDVLSKDEDISELTIHNWNVQEKVVEAGNNYASGITRLTINYEKTGKQLSKIYILKVPSMSPMYEFGVEASNYQKEITMYAEVLPKMRKLNKNIDLAPRHFATLGKHSLLLEDLSRSGYRIAARKEQLDFEHCRIAFKCLAKYHAFSVKLHQTNDLPNVARKLLFEDNDGVYEKVVTLFRNGCSSFIKTLPGPYKEKYSEKLLKVVENLHITFREQFKPKVHEFCVLSHGDFWMTNIMFRYSEPYDIVEDIKLIDFQGSCWTTPVIDILKFTITSMQFEVYEKYFDLLLEIYLEALNKTLEYFGADTYKMEDLQRDISARNNYRLIFALTILPIVLADMNEEECSKLVDTMADDESGNVFFQKAAGVHSNRIIMKWLDRFIEEGMLDD